jgi:hypothetical protein
MAEIGRTVGAVSELTVIDTIVPDRVEPLQRLLATLHAQAIFQAVPVVHFARFVVIHPGEPGAGDTYLFFNSIYDGSLEDYLAALLGGIPEQWNAVWSHCTNWPGDMSLEALAEFVHHHAVTAGLLYASYPSATLPEVLRALRVDEAVQEFLDAVPDLLKQAPGALNPLDKSVQELIIAARTDPPAL